MYMLRILWVLSGIALSISFTPLNTYAQPTGHPPLLQYLLNQLKDHNYQYLSARLKAAAEAQRPAQVSQLPDPKAGISFFPLPVVTARGEQRSQWRIEQAIPYPPRLRLQGEIASTFAEASTYAAEAIRLQAESLLKQAYSDIFRIQKELELIQEFQQQLRVFEEAAASRYTVGKGSQQAILKAQLERNTLEQRQLQLQAQYKRAFEQIVRLIGQSDLPDDTLSAELPSFTPLPSVDTLITFALANHPELMATTYRLRAQEKRIALAHKFFYPDFTLSLQYIDIANRGPTPATNGKNALAIGVGVRIPLQRKRLHARVEEARLQFRQTQAQLEDLRLALQTQIEDLYYQLKRTEDQLNLLLSILIPQAQATLESSLSAYSTGKIDFLALLDAERMLYQLNVQRLQLHSQWFMQLARLERALGVTSLTELNL